MRQVSQKKHQYTYMVRPALQNWFLRGLALLIFISGGALARAVAQEIETHFAPFENPAEHKQLKAVAVEVRLSVQPEAVNPPLQAVPPQVGQATQILAYRAVRGAAWVILAFDALAPPA